MVLVRDVLSSGCPCSQFFCGELPEILGAALNCPLPKGSSSLETEDRAQLTYAEEDRDVDQSFAYALNILMNFKLSEQHIQILYACVHAYSDEGEGRCGDIFVFSLNLKY